MNHLFGIMFDPRQEWERIRVADDSIAAYYFKYLLIIGIFSGRRAASDFIEARYWQNRFEKQSASAKNRAGYGNPRNRTAKENRIMKTQTACALVGLVTANVMSSSRPSRELYSSADSFS